MQVKSVAYVGTVIGMAMILSAGCSSKALQSDGAVSAAGAKQQGVEAGKGSQSSANNGGSFPDTMGSGGSGMTNAATSDSAGNEQRVVADPMPPLSALESERQAAEQRRRAEEAATAAAGFQDVFFDYDSFSLSESGQQALVHNAAWMAAHPDRKVRIEGQCDERGTQSYNQVLGEKRAKIVQRYLKDLGVANELSVISLGKDRPWCTDHTESCYQQNRRGHLVVRVD